MVKRLSDYHNKFPHGKENEMQVRWVRKGSSCKTSGIAWKEFIVAYNF